MKITLGTKYNKDTKALISVDEFKSYYLWGIELQKYGKEMPDEVYQRSILRAQEAIEELLQIKLVKQIYSEDKTFFSDDWKSWGYIPTQYPVVCPIDLVGFLGTVRQVQYPKEWLSAKRTSDNQYLHRQLYIVPNSRSTFNQLVVYQGILPNVNYFANSTIPYYWKLSYVTGWDRDKIPATILAVIGKIAALDILAVASDAMLYSPGIASTSISLDGLSQSLSSVASGQNGLFGARIKQYLDELFGRSGRDGEINRLKDTYTALIWGTA